MPPTHVPTARDTSRIAAIFTPPRNLSELSSLLFLVFVFAVCTRVVVTQFEKRRKRSIMSEQKRGHGHGQETRKDSASDCSSRTVSPERQLDSKSHEIKSETASPHSPRVEDVRTLNSPSSPKSHTEGYIKIEDQEPTAFQPIYPWIMPPQALPGPYDLPLPTLRRHCPSEPGKSPSSIDSNPTTPEVEEDEAHMLPYTRHVSTTTSPPQSWVYSGTITTSTSGWRRNQWVVSGG